jgi:hypothetical protein
MGFIRDTAKKAVFWTYPRTSWQWDVLCVLILVFIFLTPKGWFENKALQLNHKTQTAVFVKTDVVGVQLDKADVERRARGQLGRLDAQVMSISPRFDEGGKVVAYEVDFR